MEGVSTPVQNVTTSVLKDLQDQHDWTDLKISNIRNGEGSLRPLIKGLPPRRLYMHPDDQIAALALEQSTGQRRVPDPEHEWVLAIHLTEQWTLKRFAAIFDSLEEGGPRGKRITLAAVHNDSTVVYYLMHEGMVKPRQN